MEPVVVVILVAVLEFLVLGFMVGYARGKYGVKAPAVSGHEVFDRHFRVHYNTLEQLIVFLPSVWFFGQYVSALWATVLGSIYIIGRIVFAVGYVADPSKRSIGFSLSSLPVIILALGALYGVIRVMLAQ